MAQDIFMSDFGRIDLAPTPNRSLEALPLKEQNLGFLRIATI
jgi:hypothetical protein